MMFTILSNKDSEMEFDATIDFALELNKHNHDCIRDAVLNWRKK